MLKGYYSGIDKLPLQAWIDCNGGNLSASRIDPNVGDAKKDSLAWTWLYDDFLKQVPQSDEFKDFLANLKDRANKQIEYLLSDKGGKRDRKFLNEINYLTGKIQNYHMKGKSEKTMSVTKILNVLSKSQGYQIRIKDLTTLAYFELLNDYNTQKHG